VTRPRGTRFGSLLVGACALPLLIAIALAGCSRHAAPGLRVIVLGFDGMDYGLASALMAEGLMPNFSRVAATGSFSPLATSIPPQSPVAWSNFITGLSPGDHGIFDFVHRDPATRVPYLSTSRTTKPAHALDVGRYRLPLSAGRVELLRRGRPFWEALEQRGVRTTIVRMPVNFPPSGLAHRELSGMGTPDLVGTYGTFSFYTSAPFAFSGRQPGGGRAYRVAVRDNLVQGVLQGPDNPFLREPHPVAADFAVYVDDLRPVARIVLGGEERILQVGEWSSWVPFEFPLIASQGLRGMVRFYLKQVRPDFELYVSPVNLDPVDPALPISTPPSFAAQLAHASGRFYTQGMPEDTKALEEGVLTRDEFLVQAKIAGDEVIGQFAHVLRGFENGLLFYYVGNLDQISHMMWRSMDPGHPAYDPVADPPYRDVIRDAYIRLDAMVGETLGRMGGDTTLIVMSDHGFTSWRRSFNLNSWLRDHGYLALSNPDSTEDPGLFGNVDWSRTRAYGLGLNALYVNLEGREPQGAVSQAERERLLSEIASRLLGTIDPVTGQPAVAKVYRPDRVFSGPNHPGIAPDLIIGYAKGTRGSNESALGGLTPDVIADNRSMWSGDHCMDPDSVPGLLLTNRPLRRAAPSLQELSLAILAEFGVE
jgi:predicted AlkP superfamily phosphohydrolase/phosphomutase